jgi:Tol biopolymer transport system component
MSLASGTRLGAYEIVGLIGAGGMGEVYKARDGRLDRTVAVKTLPSRVAADPNLRQRFEREAKALATLSHPHICSVFDVGHATTDQGAIDFLVIEYLEGETLAQRLGKGALPSADALRYAVETADALDKAHRKGVIHRDLKPGNIMLTPQGVKLLDFGLAKLVTGPLDADVTKAAVSPLTGAGTIVGTFQYMAPEQLEGQEADARSDIFAFGAVLYEMFTGRKAFEGKSQASLVGAILEREPASVSTVQPASPPALDQIVKTCLAKNPENRWQSAADVGRQLQWIRDGVTPSTASAPTPVAPSTVRRPWLLPVAAVGLVAVAAVGLAIWALTRPSAPKQVSRLLLAPAASAPLVSVGGYDVAISPDGTKIVYLGEAQQGGRALYVRALGGLEPQRIPGTDLPSDFENANPFFSWDGQSIGFRSPGKGILRVALTGGPPVKIADDDGGFVGGAWGPDDNVIIAIAGTDSALFKASAGGGGSMERLTPPVDQPGTGVFYTAPSLLPSGKAVLFYILRLQQQSETVTVLDLETRKLKTLLEGGANPQYVPSGHLVFARGTTLMAVPFDVNRLEVAGTPVAVLPGVRHPGLLTAADYGVSRNGMLIYVPGPESSGGGTAVTPVWVDRQGRPAGSVGNAPLLGPRNPRLSPDATRLLLISGLPGRAEMAVFHLDGRPPLPLAQGNNILGAIWSPDGTHVFFASNRDGAWATYSIPSDGSTLEPQLIAITPPDAVKDAFIGQQAPVPPLAWMPNGHLLLAGVRASGGPSPGADLVTVPAEGGTTEDFVRTEYVEDAASVSPDGRFVAYRSTRSGRSEIWVQAAAGSAPVRVSQNGGREPLWSRDGRELFYLEGNKLIALAVKPGQEFSFSPPTVLFDQPYFHGFGGNPGLLDPLRSYDVAKDGRFIMIPPPGNPNVGAAPPPGIVVVQNWSEELKTPK